MPINIKLPKSGGFTITDLFGVIDSLTTESTFTGFAPTLITGNGSYQGVAFTFTMLGTGFQSSVIGGEPALTGGIVHSITVNSASAGTIKYLGSIDMSEFSPIILADVTGADPLGIETYLMESFNWVINLSDLDDIAPKGTMIGDGIALNTTGRDIIRGYGGNDNLFSGDANDKLFGNNGNDTLAGGKGRDVVKGGSGNDRVNGDSGNDKLFGNGGRDVIKGGTGRDVLDGGTGRDVLFGGKGADKFIFKDGYGRDKITDFDANNNKEDINLKAVTEITNFADLKANHMDQVGENVVINDGAGTVITLLGVDINDLGKADFLF